jgi:hypothetical protein
MTFLFSTEARHQFDPVAQKFGLVCVASTEWGLRYENDKVFLTVNFDSARSYELGVEIGKKNTKYPGPPFSLAEVLRLRDVQDAEFVSGLMISDETRLPDVLSRLAKLTVSYASDFLMGNDFSFAQVEKMRNKESAEFELVSRLRYAKSTVDVAWSEKDYEAIVRVLEPLEQHLSPAEKKRLEYSRKQLPHS